jgi:hypothetical protein
MSFRINCCYNCVLIYSRFEARSKALITQWTAVGVFNLLCTQEAATLELIHAAESGDTLTVQKALARNADVDAQPLVRVT